MANSPSAHNVQSTLVKIVVVEYFGRNKNDLGRLLSTSHNNEERKEFEPKGIALAA